MRSLNTDAGRVRYIGETKKTRSQRRMKENDEVKKEEEEEKDRSRAVQ